MASTQDVPPRGGSMSVTPHGSTPAAAPPTPVPSPSAPPPPAHNGENNRNHGRAMLVGAILAGLVISTAVMVGFIAYRWWGVNEPTTAVIVTGDESLDGTVVTVTGGPKPERTVLAAVNGYRADILLVPGSYVVTAERNGEVLLRREVMVERHLAVAFDLKQIAEQLQRARDGAGTVNP